MDRNFSVMSLAQSERQLANHRANVLNGNQTFLRLYSSQVGMLFKSWLRACRSYKTRYMLLDTPQTVSSEQPFASRRLGWHAYSPATNDAFNSYRRLHDD